MGNILSGVGGGIRGHRIRPFKSRNAHIKHSTPEIQPEVQLQDQSKLSPTASPAHARNFTLKHLPLEIIYEITSHLPTSGARSLSNTGRHFYYLLPPHDVYDVERFKFLCFLDRDKLLSRPVCSGCMITHEKPYFRPADLSEQAEFRKCLKTQGLLWICPYKALNFVEAKGLANSSSQVSCPHFCCKWGGAPSWSRDNNGHCKVEYSYFLCSSILVRIDRKAPPRDAVRDILKGYDLPICPHLRMSDPAILDIYNPHCSYDGLSHHKCSNGCNCRNCNGRGGTCRFCETRYEFRMSRDYRTPSPTVDFRLRIVRDLGCMESATHMSWLSQLMVVRNPDFANHCVGRKLWWLNLLRNDSGKQGGESSETLKQAEKECREEWEGIMGSPLLEQFKGQPEPEPPFRPLCMPFQKDIDDW